ncbi:hypothetical protein LWI29_006946 [Acer saccharum]|uniref:Disease resistance protein n=1 Tax=Acer saccharum TaxID=4024 RepID=A0AA39T2U7_ACESA|nr:hypothetical protein LWI29_006946 [Acer saccharum]
MLWSGYGLGMYLACYSEKVLKVESQTEVFSVEMEIQNFRASVVFLWGASSEQICRSGADQLLSSGSMEIVKECGTSILSTIVEDLVKSTGQQVGYIFRFKSIIEELNEEAKNLKSTQDDMQHRVDRAKKDTDEIEKKVEKWLRDVTDVVADAEDFKWVVS